MGENLHDDVADEAPDARTRRLRLLQVRRITHLHSTEKYCTVLVM